jgi:hypothetical protein
MLSRNHNNDIQMFAVVWSIFGSSLKAALELIVARKNLEKKEVLIGHLIFMTRLILRRHLVSFPNKNELS